MILIMNFNFDKWLVGWLEHGKSFSDDNVNTIHQLAKMAEHQNNHVHCKRSQKKEFKRVHVESALYKHNC